MLGDARALQVLGINPIQARDRGIRWRYRKKKASPPLRHTRFGPCASHRRRFGFYSAKRFRLLQIARIKPFGEPAVDRGEKLACLLPLALIAPEPGHAHCGAEFPGSGLLLTGNFDRALSVARQQQAKSLELRAEDKLMTAILDD
jgi:hypothetical protein